MGAILAMDDDARRKEQYNNIYANIKPLTTTGKGKNLRTVTGSVAVPLSCCYVDERYQGMRAHKRLNRLRSRWDVRKLTPITLVPHMENPSMRIVNSSENNMNRRKRSDNTSGIVGVCWNKNKGKWMSYICAYGKRKTLGYFDNFENAVKVRRDAEKEYFGEYAYNWEDKK